MSHERNQDGDADPEREQYRRRRSYVHSVELFNERQVLSRWNAQQIANGPVLALRAALAAVRAGPPDRERVEIEGEFLFARGVPLVVFEYVADH